MSYKIFLDDIRTVKMVYPQMSDLDFHVVRSYSEFVSEIEKYGLPSFISFDNDLGSDKEGNLLNDGYDAAKWLVYESGLNLIDLKFNVHSANPVASKNIRILLKNYIKFLKGS